MEFHCEQNRSGQWCWALKTETYKTLAVSTQSYPNRQDCLDAITLLQQSAIAKVKEK